MKTRFLRLGKSSISLALSVLMIISTVLVGSSVTVEPMTDDETVAVDVAKNITNTDEIVENTTDMSFDNNKKSTLKKRRYFQIVQRIVQRIDLQVSLKVIK